MVYIVVGIVLCMFTIGMLSIFGMTSDDDNTYLIIQRLNVFMYCLILVLSLLGFVVLWIWY